MNCAKNTKIVRKHFHDHQEKLCTAVLQSFLCAQHFVFNEGYFYSRSFPTYSRTSVENLMTFQEYPTIFQFSRTFQDPCEPWFPSFEWLWTYILTGLDLWNVQTVQLYSWDILTALFPVLCILKKQHGIRGGKYLRKTSGNTISKCLYNICLDPQELVPLVRVPKLPTIHYQLAT